jgi:hypothetical protein
MIDIDNQYTAFQQPRYAVRMKRSTVAAVLFALATTATGLRAQNGSQTDAMPPETKAPMQGDMAGHVKPAVKESKFVSITFRGATTTLTLTDLTKLPQVTITAKDGHTGKDVTFTGPLVSDVLAKAGLVESEDTHQLILHSSVIATGADGYFVLYSGAELSQMFARSKAIVAIMRYELPNTEGGLIQIVNPNDAKPARWVHGLASLNVMSIAPTK